MKKILRVYAVCTTICVCIISLIVGTMTAEKNTRELSFGEKYDSVAVYSSSSDAVILDVNNKQYGLPNAVVYEAQKLIKDLKPLYPAFVNNFNWFTENIKRVL